MINSGKKNNNGIGCGFLTTKNFYGILPFIPVEDCLWCTVIIVWRATWWWIFIVCMDGNMEGNMAGHISVCMKYPNFLCIYGMEGNIPIFSRSATLTAI